MNTTANVRDAIVGFLDGCGVEPWSWDDFTSVPLKDPFLDAVRRVCVFVPTAYPPPYGSRQYCSDAGADLMRAIADRLV